MEECCFSNIPPWIFSRRLNCESGTKSRKASHMQDFCGRHPLRCCYYGALRWSLLKLSFHPSCKA